MQNLSLINSYGENESEILEIIRKNPSLIRDQILQTEERCLVAVRQSGELLAFIPKGNQTYEMCMTAINNDVRAFAFVAKKIQTIEMCETVLSKEGRLLEYVANELLCPVLCNIAVKNNPHALRYVPYRFLSNDLVMSAIKADYHVLKYVSCSEDLIPEILALNGLALEHVHSYELRKTHCLTAVEQNPLALKFVPEKYLSQKMCDSAVKRNPMAIQYVPIKFLTEKLCKKAIASNLYVFKFIPDEYKSEQLCKDAIAVDPKMFEFVPNHFKTEEMSKSVITALPWLFGFVPQNLLTAELCDFAMKTDYRALRYVPHRFLDKNNYIKFHQYIVRIAEEDAEFASDMQKFYAMAFSEWPEEIRNDKQIIAISRQLGLRSVVKKCYLSETQSFYVKERIPYVEPIENEFSCFDEFYNYLDGDLQNADLYHYDFFNIDLSKYSLIGANVNSKVLWKNGLYDPSFYDLTVSDTKGYTQNDVSSSSELIPAEAVLHDTDIGGTISRTSRKLYYISDLHINHKLLKKFPDYATQYEIECAVNEIVEKLLRTAQERNEDDYLLIAGDISFNFETAKLFYCSLAQRWRNVILVLGNHELWNLQQNDRSIDHCILQYQNLCNELGFIFLHNELLILDDNDFRHIISENELKNASANDLQAFRKKLININRLIVFGGLGFSGYNCDYNAQNGLYRDVIRTLEEDLAETRRFETIYNKLLDTMSDLPIIILTHTPVESWSKRSYNPDWIYVNGHTHRNQFFCDEERTVYADNQIGYHNYSSIGLKFFYLQKSFDVFADYPDGIHPITREQYLSFNKGMQIRMNFNRTDGQIHMLKRSGIYCFIYENQKNTYLLSGGALNKLENKDLQYYYQRLPLYADVVNTTFSHYYTLLDRVSQAVKRIGGSGHIHGSIVDISFLNHIFVNPEDFSITPYFALSTVQKIFYPNVQTLLLEHCKDLHANYLELQGNQSKETMLLANLPNSNQISKATYVPDTGMYKLSKLVKRVQFLVDKKVVRIWDDTLLANKKEIKEMLLMLES